MLKTKRLLILLLSRGAAIINKNGKFSVAALNNLYMTEPYHNLSVFVLFENKWLVYHRFKAIGVPTFLK